MYCVYFYCLFNHPEKEWEAMLKATFAQRIYFIYLYIENFCCSYFLSVITLHQKYKRKNNNNKEKKGN